MGLRGEVEDGGEGEDRAERGIMSSLMKSKIHV